MRGGLISTLVLVALLVLAVPSLLIWLTRPEGLESGPGDREPVLRVYFHREGQVRVVPLEEYLVGVVAAEMPALFEPEALKAQAVVARTYALKRVEEAAGHAEGLHPGADVCTDPTHCQAWYGEADLRKTWGSDYATFYRKVRQTVQATSGIVVTYQGRLIDPVYHGDSGGHTEDSEEVWQVAVPYLRGVVCPWSSKGPDNTQKQWFSLGEVDQALGTSLATRVVSNDISGGEPAIQVEEYTRGGRVKLLRIANQLVTGREVRERLALASTRFSWQVNRQGITFTTVGKGHGVGLCQYGADGMATDGYTYADIVRYFYQGVALTKHY